MADQAPAVVVTPQAAAGGQVVVSQSPHANGGGMVTSITSGVFDAFKTSPVLLLIVILNAAFIIAAAYYMLQVEAYRAKDREALGSLLSKCLTEAVPVEYLKYQQDMLQRSK